MSGDAARPGKDRTISSRSSSHRARHGRSGAAPAPGISQAAWSRARLVVFFGLLLLCLAGGGASRLDARSLLYLQPAAIVAGACLLLIPGPRDWARVRAPLWFLAALALVMVLQLIPLPPGLWGALPGHERFLEAATAAGLPQPWRPISISPDLTLASLLGLTVPAAVLIGMAALDSYRAERLLLVGLVMAVVASGVLGIAQVSRGAGSGLYLYEVTNDGMAVGFFANRNHQAALLACAFPLLAAWASARSDNPEADRARRWIAALLGVLIVPLIVVTGSRTGLPLGALGLAAAALIFWMGRPAGGGRRATLIALLPWLGGVALLVVAFFLSKAAAFQRLFSLSLEDDQRIRNFDLFVTMTRDFFPFGSGFGTFDPAFRIYEPDAHLRIEYLNHAHNDLMELLITAGLFGALLVALFLLWSARSGWRTVRALRASGAALRVAGMAIVLILFAASLLDYPLRTPLLMAVLAIAVTWFGAGGLPRPPGTRRTGPKSFTAPGGGAIGPATGAGSLRH